MDRIYIIESPSDIDLLEGRTEGDSLSNVLELADMDVSYMLATSLDTFNQAMNFIIEDFHEKSGKSSAMPYIHVSSHGDEGGIILTNGEYYDWNDFTKALEEINSTIGYVPLDSKYSDKVSRIILCLSTCKGFNGFKIHKNDVCPYQAVIGPKEDVEWSDSVTAFITFYHLANYKNSGLPLSVEKMNQSAGLESIFDIVISPEVGRIMQPNRN